MDPAGGVLQMPHYRWGEGMACIDDDDGLLASSIQQCIKHRVPLSLCRVVAAGLYSCLWVSAGCSTSDM